MKWHDQNFRTEALRLSDEIGVKKACEQLKINLGIMHGWKVGLRR